MICKSIYITKKKLAFISVLILGIAIGVIFIPNQNQLSIPAVNIKDSEILEQGLPSEDKNFDSNSIISHLIGFNLSEPGSIISAFSSIFEMPDKSQIQNLNEPVPSASASPPSSPKPENSIVFPDKSQINSAVNLQLNNATSYSVDINSLCKEDLGFSIENNGSVQVLIVHTHTTECFDGDAMNGETERTTDDTKNITAVGDIIAQTLEKNGIHCVHDKTVHDYPSYQSAYTRTLSTIEYNLNKYPDIKVILDIHRDAFIYPDGSKLTVNYDQNGESVAQVMIVAGTDSLGLEHPSWQKNLSFAAKIQSAANIMYPGMMRPINLRRERFNMHMTSGSLLLEIGSNGNSLSEAIAAGENIANAISAVLNSN